MESVFGEGRDKDVCLLCAERKSDLDTWLKVFLISGVMMTVAYIGDNLDQDEKEIQNIEESYPTESVHAIYPSFAIE